MLLEINPEHPQPRRLQRAVDVLQQGGVIAYPTGTVFGFGAALHNRKAVERVYQIKQTSIKNHKPFSFLCADLSEIAKYAQVSNAAYRLMRRLVPGPYTFILKASKEVPKFSITKRKTVGIRVPDHPVTQALLRMFGAPIISTSAMTVDDEWPLVEPWEVEQRFPQVDLVIDAGPGGVMPSTVLAIHDDGSVEVIREGAGPVDHLLD